MSWFNSGSRSLVLHRLPLGFVIALGACGASDAVSDRTEQTVALPTWATSERLIGRVDPAEPLTIQVHLALRDLEAAGAELYAVSDPD
ncbi:hypothetical protein, partial [Salmonella sp. SAL4356]|uniref:hypothetical protein n=1 Tax=Salmonella sp. SAL4356 TaxID=3159877 RepID=UPI00397CEC93